MLRNSLPRGGDRAQPIPEAHRVEALPAAGIIAGVVNGRSSRSSQRTIYIHNKATSAKFIHTIYSTGPGLSRAQHRPQPGEKSPENGVERERERVNDWWQLTGWEEMNIADPAFILLAVLRGRARWPGQLHSQEGSKIFYKWLIIRPGIISNMV